MGMSDILKFQASHERAGRPAVDAGGLRLSQRYFAHDFFVMLLFARILCDRSLQVLHLVEPKLPISVASFRRHRSRVLSGATLPPSLCSWSQYVRSRTEWFELLKDLRDDYIVHQSPKHEMMFGQRSDHDIEQSERSPVSEERAGLEH